MIEVVNPGWLSFFVDHGRRGFADIGVAASSAMDRYAFDTANFLVGNPPNTPVLEAMGRGFAVRAGLDVWCAVTGAKVRVSVDEAPVEPWGSFPVPEGAVVTVKEVEEGLRYYVGFSGTPALAMVMDSCTTSLECRFGGFMGRPLMKGDRLAFREVRPAARAHLPRGKVPDMSAPHLLRVVEGPEMGRFTEDSLRQFFSHEGDGNLTVSQRLNRTAIRLEGAPLAFREGAEASIVSEGILPGTIQIPGDGLPLITLYERTIGGYARLGMIARVDRDLLAHLKPKDRVALRLVSLEEARRLWEEKRENHGFTIKGR
jgi:biotin-dependent carboxylase-like uncharacterized protein